MIKHVGINCPGPRFETEASDDWAVGQELITYQGVHVRVTARRENPRAAIGSWKYIYTFDVIPPEAGSAA